jgi:hypothetical protein
MCVYIYTMHKKLELNPTTYLSTLFTTLSGFKADLYISLTLLFNNSIYLQSYIVIFTLTKAHRHKQIYQLALNIT